MTRPAVPFTPETLALRWLVSDETIRQLCHRQALRHFRVGRMIRIPAEAVEGSEPVSPCDDCIAGEPVGEL